METLPFEKCFIDVTGGNIKIKQVDYLSEGKIPIIDQGKVLIGGFTNNVETIVKCKLPCVIYGDHSRNIKYFEKPFAIGADGVKLLEASEKMIPKYGYYFLQTVKLPDTGYDRSFKYLKRIQIPLPDHETQNKIVAILDKVKAILDKREKTIRKYDELLRATFLEMFGDPFLNPKGWSKMPIQNICSNVVDCPHTTPVYLDSASEFPCIRTSEIKNGEILWQSMKYISEERYLERISRLRPEENDIIFGREGTVGEALLIPSNLKISLGQRVMLFRVDKKQVNPVFFWAQIVSDGIQFEINKRTIGATVKRINIGDLIKIPFVIPPMELQNQFVMRIERILSLKRKVKTHLNYGTNLLKSLTQQVFSERITIDVDAELEALINAIDLDKKDKENKVDSVINDITFIQRLIDRLGDQQFDDKEQYDKAKYILFRIMREEEDLVKQVFKNPKVKLTLQNETA